MKLVVHDLLSFNLQVPGDRNSTVLTGLDPDSDYYVTVSVSTVVGKTSSNPLVLSHPVKSSQSEVG